MLFRSDVARKVVGVGSVGLQAWVILLWGKGANDPLMLQVKEAQRSVLADYVPAASYPGEGFRVIEGQQMMQAASDMLLGAVTGQDAGHRTHDYYVRQLRDGKGSVVIEALDADGMKEYALLCGRTLAHAHARTVSGASSPSAATRWGSSDSRSARVCGGFCAGFMFGAHTYAMESFVMIVGVPVFGVRALSYPLPHHDAARAAIFPTGGRHGVLGVVTRTRRTRRQAPFAIAKHAAVAWVRKRSACANELQGGLCFARQLRFIQPRALSGWRLSWG